MRCDKSLIEELRKKSGMTQAELSQMSGVSIKTIQLWESNGTMSANVGKLAHVADALGVSVNEIIN